MKANCESGAEVSKPDALRLMQQHDNIQVAKFAKRRQDIEDGLGSGPAVDWDPDDIERAGHARRTAKWESGARNVDALFRGK